MTQISENKNLTINPPTHSVKERKDSDINNVKEQSTWVWTESVQFRLHPHNSLWRQNLILSSHLLLLSKWLLHKNFP